VAVNQAVTDMRVGLTDAAIVCGSHVMLNPFHSQHLLKLGVLSPETLSQVFDAEGKFQWSV
jgi:acyl transferase domain-containing protein